MDKPLLFNYCIHLADTVLILGQRNSEWCGHGPVLEQDIAITNISLDLLGQARNFYQYAAEVYNGMQEEERKKADDLTPILWQEWNRALAEDDVAFLRQENQYLNLGITELPTGDWAQTVLRQFLFSAFQFLQYDELQKSGNEQLAAIAEKSIKEISYHLRWSSEWVIRLGDGTKESNSRMMKAAAQLWPFTKEFFQPANFEIQANEMGFGADVNRLKEVWLQKVTLVFEEATLLLPADDHEEVQLLCKEGKHTEYFPAILSEMQYLQRKYPNMSW